MNHPLCLDTFCKFSLSLEEIKGDALWNILPFLFFPVPAAVCPSPVAAVTLHKAIPAQTNLSGPSAMGWWWTRHKVLPAVPALVPAKIWGRLWRKQPREWQKLGGWGIPGGKGRGSDRLRWALRVRIDGSSIPNQWHQVNLESCSTKWEDKTLRGSRGGGAHLLLIITAWNLSYLLLPEPFKLLLLISYLWFLCKLRIW